MARASTKTLDFIQHAEKINVILHEASTAIEEVLSFTPSDGQKQVLKDAANSLYSRSKGFLPDEQRTRLREAVTDAVVAALLPEAAYTESGAHLMQEILLRANTAIQEAVLDVMEATPAKGTVSDGKQEAFIVKDTEEWQFSFAGEQLSVPVKKLDGLKLIEELLLHPGKEYTPLALLKAAGQRGQHKTEPERIYTDRQIKVIQRTIQDKKERLASSTDAKECKGLEAEITKAEKMLYKSRDYHGKGRPVPSKYRVSVIRKVDKVLSKIAPKHKKLYEHLDRAITRGTLCHYKPESEIFWAISEETTQATLSS